MAIIDNGTLPLGPEKSWNMGLAVGSTAKMVMDNDVGYPVYPEWWGQTTEEYGTRFHMAATRHDDHIYTVIITRSHVWEVQSTDYVWSCTLGRDGTAVHHEFFQDDIQVANFATWLKDHLDEWLMENNL